MSSSLLKSLVVLQLIASTAHLVLVGAEDSKQSNGQNAVTIRIVLQGRDIPSNGSGVVIFHDIGGFLGPQDGLLCTVDRNFTQSPSSSYWAEPHGAQITQIPGDNQFGINYDCIDRKGIALYYNNRAKPTDRGLFKCVITTDTNISLNASVHIVDMNISESALIGSGPIVVGDNVSISVNMTITSDNTPIHIPYQWRLNGTDLQLDDSTYEGVQTNRLTITNVQARHQGEYTCQVAHSASGTTKPVTLSLLSITVQLTSNPTINNTMIGKHFTLTCKVHGDDAHQGRAKYTWYRDGEKIVTKGEKRNMYTFDQLEFEDAGHYKCQVSMTFGKRNVTYESNEFPLTISMVTYQIYLKLGKDKKCTDWTTTHIKHKVKSIIHEICTGVTDTCKLPHNTCHFIKNDTHHVYGRHGYKCLYQLPHTVSYDVTLQRIPEVNTTLSYLIDCLDDWIQRNIDTISVYDVQLRIDKSCSQVLDKQNTPECSGGSAFTAANGLGIGLGVSCVVNIVLIAAIIVMVMWYKRRTHPDYDNLR